MTGNNKGYTLLEVLAAVGLISLLFVVVLQFSRQGISFFTEARNNLDTSQNVLIAFRELERQIKSSEAILFPAPGTGDNRLRLKQGPNIWDELEFYNKMPNQLWQVKSGGHNPVADNLQLVTFFRYAHGKSIEVTIRAEGLDGGEQVYRGVVTLRR